MDSLHPRPTDADLCVEQLANDLAMMAERAVNAEADRDGYRTLAQETLHALRFVMIERDQLRRRVRQLLETLRTRRSQDQRAA